MSSVARAPCELGVFEPLRGCADVRSGLSNRDGGASDAASGCGEERPDEPRSACERLDVPGPGVELPPAPASGVLIPSDSVTCGLDGRGEGEGLPPGEPTTGDARRAVAEAREGEWKNDRSSVRVDGLLAMGLDGEDGKGRGLPCGIAMDVLWMRDTSSYS